MPTSHKYFYEIVALISELYCLLISSIKCFLISQIIRYFFSETSLRVVISISLAFILALLVTSPFSDKLREHGQLCLTVSLLVFPGGSVGKNSPTNAGFDPWV